MNERPSPPDAGAARLSAGAVRGTAEYDRLSRALIVAGFSTFALLYGVQPLLPLYATEFHQTAAQASLVVSMATGAMAFALIPAGLLSDRIGRVPVMTASMFGSSLLTLLSAMLPGWHTLLAMRALTGVALAGLPAIAMAYVAEEVEATSTGGVMGLYVAGSAMGGVLGRFATTLVTDLFDWRLALALLGVVGLASAVAFRASVPPTRGFTPTRYTPRSLLAATRRLLSDGALPCLYAEGFLLMGIFVTIYNYVGFHLQAPPYALSHTSVGAIFLVYIVGAAAAAWFGGLAGRVGRRKVFWMPIVALGLGVALTLSRPLVVIIAGIIVVTIGFFAGHATASAWVGRRALENRAHASSLYLVAYYLGSTSLGSAGGLAWTWGGWPAVVWFALLLGVAALAIAGRLARVPPIPDAMRAAAVQTSVRRIVA